MMYPNSLNCKSENYRTLAFQAVGSRASSVAFTLLFLSASKLSLSLLVETVTPLFPGVVDLEPEDIAPSDTKLVSLVDAVAGVWELPPLVNNAD